MIKKVVLIGNYPPRQCGIATFTQDLLLNLQLLLPEVQLAVCAMNESELDTHAYPPEVVLQIDQENKNSYIQAAKIINEHAKETIVIVEHEYGIYGGESGKFLVDLLDSLLCPIIITLHTVVSNPNKEMRLVTEHIIEKCNKLITLTNSSCSLFKSLYPRSINKVISIEHGIHPLLYKTPKESKPKFKLENRKVLLTFGLLSRNKGIEYIISALPQIKIQIPDIIYLIVGGTHPTVIRQEGESYRLELMKLVKNLSLKENVRFVPDYLPVKDILLYIQSADIYIASSLDPDQAVSGTLSYALGSGRAVIATEFAQAKEIVNPKIGRIVPIGNSKAISEAVIELFAKPKRLQTMNRTAYANTRSMLWSNVADDYATCINEVANSYNSKLVRWPNFNWNHLIALTDEFGLLQFAEYTVPKQVSGYTLDDNSRALQVVQYAYELGFLPKTHYDNLSKKYLQVMNVCLSQSLAVNYLASDSRLPTDQNLKEDLSDSMARAFYALQTVKHTGSEAARHMAVDLLNKLPVNPDQVSYIRSMAQMLLGASFAMQNGDNTMSKLVDTLSKKLVESFYKNSTPDWRWFDMSMTYANGQLCSSLIEAARVTSSAEFRKIGLESLEFLSKTCFMGDVYAPIGQGGWRNRDTGSRALFDQQPEDAFSTMQALESAYNLTGNKQYVLQAEKVFSWFMGNNLIGARVYDDNSGGCHDGLTPNGVNQNEGAESTLSYLNARLIMARLGA